MPCPGTDRNPHWVLAAMLPAGARGWAPLLSISLCQLQRFGHHHPWQRHSGVTSRHPSGQLHLGAAPVLPPAPNPAQQVSAAFKEWSKTPSSQLTSAQGCPSPTTLDVPWPWRSRAVLSHLSLWRACDGPRWVWGQWDAMPRAAGVPEVPQDVVWLSATLGAWLGSPKRGLRGHTEPLGCTVGRRKE